MHDLDAQPELLLCPLLAPTLVAGIHPQVRKAWKAITCGFQQQLNPVLLGHLCTMNLGLEHQPFRVHQQLSLAAVNFLSAVVTALFFSAYPARLSRLRIDYPCSWDRGFSPTASASTRAALCLAARRSRLSATF